MAISIRNLEKFFDDHPELSVQREEMLPRLRNVCQDKRVNSGDVFEVMGILADAFFAEFEGNAEHLRIGIEDLISSRQ